MSATHALRERTRLLGELRQIVQAMKNMAFAEMQRLARARAAQGEACAAVLRALAHLRGNAGGETSEFRSKVCLVIGAERGFCGAFNAHLAAAAVDLQRADPQLRLLIAGHRLAGFIGSGGAIDTLEGCAAIEEADAALDGWLPELLEAASRSAQLSLLHAGTPAVAHVPIWPIPRGEQEALAGVTPMHYLQRPQLLAALHRQALRLLVQRGLLESLEQENHWRLAQTQRAQDHLDELGNELRLRYARLRQAEITNELETLMSAIGGPGTNGRANSARAP
jgi:F-type H+-transporting ATPase subunit gamma